MIEVESVWHLIDEKIFSMTPHRISLSDSLGCVLAEPIFSETDQPPFDRSAMDGYAICNDDLSTEFDVLSSIRPGHDIGSVPKLQPGQALRIFTGAELPLPSLRVIMQERFSALGTRVRLKEATNENWIRFRGEDRKAGDQLIAAGAKVSAGIISILAANGNASPLVHPMPSVAHITTGDEIVPFDSLPGPGQIRDSNGPMIRALCESCGVRAFKIRHAGEDLEEIQSAISELGQPDLLLISGGASVGDHDHTRVALESAGFQIHCSSVNTRPGKPLIFATLGNRVAFGLPGNPVSHFVCFQLFVARAIARLAGIKPQDLGLGKLGEFKWKSNPRVTWWPVELHKSGAETLLLPIPWNNSGDLTPLAKANALARIPSNLVPQAGAEVEFLSVEKG